MFSSMLFAGSVTLKWNKIIDPGVKFVKIYAVPGTNTVFAKNDSNATITLVVRMPATSATIAGISNKTWSFVATSLTSTNKGLESINSNEIWKNVKNIRVNLY